MYPVLSLAHSYYFFGVHKKNLHLIQGTEAGAVFVNIEVYRGRTIPKRCNPHSMWCIKKKELQLKTWHLVFRFRFSQDEATRILLEHHHCQQLISGLPVRMANKGALFIRCGHEAASNRNSISFWQWLAGCGLVTGYDKVLAKSGPNRNTDIPEYTHRFHTS